MRVSRGIIPTNPCGYYKCDVIGCMFCIPTASSSSPHRKSFFRYKEEKDDSAKINWLFFSPFLLSIYAHAIT